LQTNSLPFYPSYFPNILTSPQKNAVKIDLRVEIIPEGALKKERKYTGIEDKTYLSKIKRPSIERLRLFQPDNHFLMRSTRGTKKLTSSDHHQLAAPNIKQEACHVYNASPKPPRATKNQRHLPHKAYSLFDVNNYIDKCVK